MKYVDRIYGDCEITEPVVLELISCPTMQRLKKIDQIGYFEPFFPGTAHSRFEHSIGDYLLLKNHGAPLEEQIAGLIHDVSHSAFSHCIDYVLSVGSEKEHNHQDNIFDRFVRKSEIVDIIKKYGLNLDYILDDRNLPLKETNVPDLCSDRLDYSFRTAVMFEKNDNLGYFLDNLITKDDLWVFKNFESASAYAKLFWKFNTNYYAGLKSAVMFRTTGDYLKYALLHEYISEADLYATDAEVLEKIKPHHEKDDDLNLLFARMNNEVGYKNDPNDYDAEVNCKSRVVDPFFIQDGKIKRVSEVDEAWLEAVKNGLVPRKYFIKFEK